MTKSALKNIKTDRKNRCYLVQIGKKTPKKYKTLKGAEAFAVKGQTKIDVPSIITANTYFWTSNGNAAQRQRSEERRRDEVEYFIYEVYSSTNAAELVFTYSESCKNVYKNFSVCINGKRSNIKGLAGLLARHGVTLVY